MSFTCEYCKKQCVNRKGLLVHMRVHDKNKAPPKHNTLMNYFQKKPIQKELTFSFFCTLQSTPHVLNFLPFFRSLEGLVIFWGDLFVYHCCTIFCTHSLRFIFSCIIFVTFYFTYHFITKFKFSKFSFVGLLMTKILTRSPYFRGLHDGPWGGTLLYSSRYSKRRTFCVESFFEPPS